MRLPAEWERQDGVMLTWPDESTPWYELEKVQACYVAIASAIQRFERVLLVAPDPAAARARMEGILASGEADALLGAPAVLDLDAVSFHACPVNDTWARDHGGISVHGDAGEKLLLDFVFNGWGLKFAADLDNQITAHICEDGAFRPDVLRVDMRPFVLEGGSIDTDGRGTLLTTTRCLCSVNRNEYLTREEIEAELKEAFGLRRILWLDDGTLDGDDTDSHVDILARFCGPGTIAYLQAEDPADPDYEALRRMHGQLASFRTPEGEPYRLVPLPKPEQRYLDGWPLPASYANFLIVNGGVLVPVSGCAADAVALARLREAFPDREVVPVNCSALLSGHGGLHCVTMQFPEGWLA